MSTEPDPSEHETDAGAHEDATDERPRDEGVSDDAGDTGDTEGTDADDAVDPDSDGEDARDGVVEVVDAGRFGGFTLGDGDCIIYDTENQCAWIQSSAYVDVESVV